MPPTLWWPLETQAGALKGLPRDVSLGAAADQVSPQDPCRQSSVG